MMLRSAREAVAHGHCREAESVEKEMRGLLTKLINRFTNQLVPDPVTERAGQDFIRLFI